MALSGYFPHRDRHPRLAIALESGDEIGETVGMPMPIKEATATGANAGTPALPSERGQRWAGDDVECVTVPQLRCGRQPIEPGMSAPTR